MEPKGAAMAFTFYCCDVSLAQRIPLWSLLTWNNLSAQVQQTRHLHGLACIPDCQALVESSHKMWTLILSLHRVPRQ